MVSITIKRQEIPDSSTLGNVAVGTTANGGGIYNTMSNVTLDNSTVSENTAIGTTAEGGGIFNNYIGATVTLVDSIVSGNIPDNCFNVPGC